MQVCYFDEVINKLKIIHFCYFSLIFSDKKYLSILLLHALNILLNLFLTVPR